MAKVLVVDDEEGIRVLCRVNLELEGYDVIEAADGPTALESARSKRPDLIFLDVMLPRMDGWDVLTELKADPHTAHIPVVMLTARTSEEDQLRAWGGGVMEYLAKPFNPRRLVDWAERALISWGTGGRGATPQAGRRPAPPFAGDAPPAVARTVPRWRGSWSYAQRDAG
jgi:DNA-binding response OmpR family regulator